MLRCLNFYTPKETQAMTKEQLNAELRARTLFEIGYFAIYMVSLNLVIICTPVPIISLLTMIGSLVMFLRSLAIKDRLHQEYDEQTNQEDSA